MPTSAWRNLAPGKGEPAWKALAREFESSLQRFVLHVRSWKGYVPLQALSWSSVPYDSTQDPTDRESGVIV